MRQVHHTSRPTPKIFGSSYQPPKSREPIRFLTLVPIVWPLVFFLIVISVSRLPIFKIKSVVVIGTEDQAIKNKLTGLVGQSIFSRQVTKIPREMLNNDLNLSALECQRGLPNTIRCVVEIRQSALIWRSAEHLFLVDQTGFVYADSVESQSNLIKVTDRANKPVVVGSSVISSDLIKTYQQLSDLLKANNLNAEELFITDSLYQVGVQITPDPSLIPAIDPKSSQKLTVLFITTAPIPAQVDTLMATLKQYGSNVHEKIDVRVPGYVYYK